MVTDPYEDDDDDPTLQRPSPASGMAARPGSGFRAAVTPSSPRQPAPPVPLEAFLEGGFPDEEDTAVDREPLAATDDASAAEPPRRVMAEPPPPMPADHEKDTVSLPIDVAAMLRLASAGTEPPTKPDTET